MNEVCKHDEADKDTAVADGMCPLCLARQLTVAREALQACQDEMLKPLSNRVVLHNITQYVVEALAKIGGAR